MHNHARNAFIWGATVSPAQERVNELLLAPMSRVGKGVIAKYLGVDRTTVGRWLTGETTMPLKYLGDLLDFFDLEIKRKPDVTQEIMLSHEDARSLAHLASIGARSIIPNGERD